MTEPTCTLCGHPAKGDVTRWTHVEEWRDEGHTPIVVEAANKVLDAGAGVEDPVLRHMGTRSPKYRP